MRQHTHIISAFFGLAVFDLFNEQILDDQKRLPGVIGACIPVFDMCFEDSLFSLDRLKSLIKQPFDFSPENGVEQLSAALYVSLVEGVRQPEMLNHLLDVMFKQKRRAVFNYHMRRNQIS